MDETAACMEEGRNIYKILIEKCERNEPEYY
jgi:hypothetical protein